MVTYPDLFTVFGLHVQSYGVSKALAALVAGVVLARAFRRHGLPDDAAWSLVIWTTVIGFAGAKLYYLAEHAGSLMPMDYGSMGFTWYGGLIAGAVTAIVIVKRRRLPVGLVSGLVAVPLSVAYGIGRLGCLLAGDGTYGEPTSLPWGMTFPHGTVPTTIPVHPTPLYEALAAFAIAALLAWAGRRLTPPATFGAYLVLSGTARFVVEILRINKPALLGLTQPQLWSILLAGLGFALLAALWRRGALLSLTDTARSAPLSQRAAGADHAAL